MSELTLPGIGLEAGGGFLIGVVMGYAAKKVAKLVAILVGLELALFKFLETKGILTVNWDQLTGVANDAASNSSNITAEGQSLFMSFISTIPLGAGFTAGALLGFKKA